MKAFVPCEVYVLHLVRDARSTLRSVSRVPSNREVEGAIRPRRAPLLRTAVGWLAANLAAYVVGRWRVGRRRYMRVRYADLVTDPSRTLRRIGRFVGEDLEEAVHGAAGGEPVAVGHVVGGSRIRFAARLQLEGTKSGDRGKAGGPGSRSGSAPGRVPVSRGTSESR